MKPRPPKVLVFGLQFLGFLVLFLGAYAVAGRYYEWLVVALAKPLAESLTPSISLEALAEGGWRFVLLRDGVWEEFSRIESGFRFVEPALLGALLLATPVAWTRRVRLLGLGWGLLLVLQVLTVVVWGRSSLCTLREPDNLLCKWLYMFCTGATQAYVVGLWIPMSWRVWFPAPSADAPAAGGSPPRRNAPCHCGSGLKYKRCCGAAR